MSEIDQALNSFQIVVANARDRCDEALRVINQLREDNKADLERFEKMIINIIKKEKSNVS